MTASPLESLSALNFAVTCQCHKHPCTALATRIVECHAVDRCDDEGLRFGNEVQLLCDQCVANLRAHVDRTITRLRKLPGSVECRPCGAPITQASDILRSETRL